MMSGLSGEASLNQDLLELFKKIPICWKKLQFAHPSKTYIVPLKVFTIL